MKKIINNEKIEPQFFYSLEIEFPMDAEVKYYLYDPKYRKYGANVDSCKEINIISDDD